MKVANIELIKDKLQQGCFLEMDFYTKCYLVDENFMRTYAVRFDTYLSLIREMKKFYRRSSVCMTDSKYFKIA